MKRIASLCLPALLTLGLSLSACSSAQQDEEALEAATEETDDTEMAEQETDDEAVSDQEEMEGLEEILADDTGSTGATTAPAASAPVEANRVVRYVREAGATAFSNAGQGESLGVFPQGTRLLVVEEGEWARVGDGMFVKANELSAKPVPRAKKNAVWSHPAH